MDSPSLNIGTRRHLDILVVHWVPKKTHFVNEDFRDLRDSSVSVGVISQNFILLSSHLVPTQVYIRVFSFIDKFTCLAPNPPRPPVVFPSNISLL